MSKKIILHSLFWGTYLFLDTLLVFFWDLPALNYLPDNVRLLLALKICLVPLIAKMVFTYVVIYIILDRALKQKGNLLINLASGIILAMATVLMIRYVQTRFVYGYVFGTSVAAPGYLNSFAILFGLLDLGFVSGAAIAIHNIRRQFRIKERENELERDKLETELTYLKNQVNPHFLFNTLNNIYALARKRSEDTAEVVMKLSKILRFMLYESGEKFIRLEDEIAIIEDYIDLEKIRHREGVSIYFKKEIDKTDYNISPFLLLPFVENAFKHGVGESMQEPAISIEIHLKEGHLFFEIVNTNEDPPWITEKNKPLGMYNSKRRLELLYPNHTLAVDNLPGIFKVRLHINVDKHGEA